MIKKKTIGYWALFLCFTFLFSMNVFALKPKKLILNKTYSWDLNGGSKESVQVNLVRTGTYRVEARLYVNDQPAYSYGFSDYGDAFLDAYYVDVDKKDKYHEIVLFPGEVNDSRFSITLLRYYNKAKVKKWILKNWNGTNAGGRIYLKSYNRKKGFVFLVDTPFFSNGFGCYLAYVPAKLTGTRWGLKKQKTYKIKMPSEYLRADKGWYKLKKKMTLYTSASTKKKKADLAVGTKFKASKIKPVGKKKTTWYSLYVKIKTSKGKSGWLYFPKESGWQNNYLKTTPLWG